MRSLLVAVGMVFGNGCAGSDGGGARTDGTTAQAPAETSKPPGDSQCALSDEGPVRFSQPSGTFQGSVDVELQATDPSLELRYTIDHTPPNANSPLYEGALSFSETTELRVQAFVDGERFGSPQTAVYIARSFDERHDLPVLVLDSYGQELPGSDPDLDPSDDPFSREYRSAAAMAFEPINGATSFSVAPVVASGAGIHVRGQSSAYLEKKPYRLELRDAQDADRDCPIFGMPSEADWVLNPAFPDKALIRNAFAYSLGADMGLAAPRARLVELYVNSQRRALESGDYQGVYLFVETIKNQKYRLDLQQLGPEDTTLPEIGGGYIFRFEWQKEDLEQRLPCPEDTAYCWDWLEVTDPKPWNQEQQDYLASHLAELATAIHASAPADLELGYPAFIDGASFANHVIIDELTKNMDGYVRSQYFYKDRDTKVFAGPLWDFDLIAGVGASQGSFENISVEGWLHARLESRWETADWFETLVADPTFRAALAERWQELRKTVLSDEQIVARIQTLTEGLAGAAERNFEKWPILTTQYIGQFETPTADSWQGQVEVMRDWLLARATWLDTQW